MKTIEELLGYLIQTIDGRDLNRLGAFMTVEQLGNLGMSIKPEFVETRVVTEYTKENVISNLTSDLKFAFEKALDKRGLSAGSMNGVIKMWMWVLNDDLADFDDYAQYGLPLLKAVAIKYNLPNPIGEDNGTEVKYSMEAY
jgi:hypothetical protein